MHMLFPRDQPIIGLDNYQIKYSEAFIISRVVFFFKLNCNDINEFNNGLHGLRCHIFASKLK